MFAAHRMKIAALGKDKFAWGPTPYSSYAVIRVRQRKHKGFVLGSISLSSADNVHFADPLPLLSEPITLSLSS